jgi:hypothetical protein
MTPVRPNSGGRGQHLRREAARASEARDEGRAEEGCGVEVLLAQEASGRIFDA